MPNTTHQQSEDDLDAELDESLVIEDLYGPNALDPMVDAWCRAQHTPAEIAERQRLAGCAPAPVLRFPIPAEQIQSLVTHRAA